MKIGRVDSREHIPYILKKISEKIVIKICSFEEAVEAWLEPAIKLVVKID
ncbi:hypothetical protein LEP1GSC198_2323 [Leptospira kirschneri str. JB]|nr:hypothetical protein LEP1GSC198_2323 [Leptospira kirschneri str. JB]